MGRLLELNYKLDRSGVTLPEPSRRLNKVFRDKADGQKAKIDARKVSTKYLFRVLSGEESNDLIVGMCEEELNFVEADNGE